MREIGIGLIGTGFMGKCHALAYNSVRTIFGSVPRPRLEILCDIDGEVARDRAGEFGFSRVTTDWRAVIADPAVELVSVTTPNGLHKIVAEAALAAGKHVWCEKPMALTLADAEAMADAADRAAGQTLLGYNYIRNPALAHARRLIEEGTIGRVFHFRGAVDEDYMADPELPWSWRCRIDQAGLGTLGDITCHLVSVAHHLLGPIARLTAQTRTIHGTRPLAEGGRARVENEDIAQSLVEFASGATGTLASSRIAWGAKNRLAWEVHGSEGTLAFDQERMNELRLFRAEGDPALRGVRTILTGPAHPPYGAFCPAPGHGLGFNELKVIELAGLLGAIAENGRSWPDFREGLAIERVIHAMASAEAAVGWVPVG